MTNFISQNNRFVVLIKGEPFSSLVLKEELTMLRLL